MEKITEFAIYALLVYVAIGLLFSIFFFRNGLTKIDEAGVGSTFGFKLIVLPGILFLWPFLLAKWKKTDQA